MSLLQLRLKWTCVGIRRRSNWDLFWDVYWIIIFLCDYMLLCLTDQLMSWCELINKLECSWCFRVFDLWFWFIDFNMIVWNCLRGFTMLWETFCINYYIEIMKWWFKLWVSDKLNLWWMVRYMCIEMLYVLSCELWTVQ